MQWTWSLTGKGKAAFVIGRAQLFSVDAERVEPTDQGQRVRIGQGRNLQVKPYGLADAGHFPSGPPGDPYGSHDLRATGDLDAAGKLVVSHLRLVVSISRQYLGYGLPHGDLIQEGNVGLMKAVKRFDPGQGVRLVSYAMHWI